MKSTKILQIPFEIPPNWFEIHRTRSLTHRLGSQFHRIRSLTHRFDSKLNRIRSSNDRRYSTEIRLTSVLSPKNIEVHRRLLPTVLIRSVLIRSISNCTELDRQITDDNRRTFDLHRCCHQRISKLIEGFC